MTDHVEKATIAFKHGIYDIIPKDVIGYLSYQELGLQLSGMPTLDVSLLKKYSKFSGYSSTDLTVKHFFEIVEEFDETMKANLIFFFSGSFKIPLGGFKDKPLKLER